MSDVDWMRPALDALIAGVSDADARAALTDPVALAEVRSQINGASTLSIPDGDRGDNLLTALLALRVKFPPEEARAKLETNLSMRRSTSKLLGAFS